MDVVHIDQIPAEFKTARRSATSVRNSKGEVVGQQPARDYQPAQGWILKIDAGHTISIHHDQTEELLKLLEQESVYTGTGVLSATLYKVDPGRAVNNVDAAIRIGSAVLRRTESAVASGELKALRVMEH